MITGAEFKIVVICYNLDVVATPREIMLIPLTVWGASDLFNGAIQMKRFETKVDIKIDLAKVLWAIAGILAVILR